MRVRESQGQMPNAPPLCSGLELTVGEIHEKSVFGDRPLQVTIKAEIADLAPVWLHMAPKEQTEQRAMGNVAIRKDFFFHFFNGLL